MRLHRVILLTAAACVAAGCNPFHRSHAVQIQEDQVPVSSRWNATLATPSQFSGALQIQGSAWMAPGSGDQTLIDISITNAAPGGQHPWQVQMGACGSDHGTLGDAGDYRPLKIGGDGKASQQATVSQQMPTTGQYHVNVYASAANMSTIIACGNLAPPLG